MIFTLLLACLAEPSEVDEDEDVPVGTALIKPAELDPKWAGAVCNDGTPFGLSVRTGESDTWVIRVAGGYLCDDNIAPCSEREKRLTTTPKPMDLPDEGLFSRDPVVNPSFHAANQVELHYCSSDLWLGVQGERTETTGSPDGWFFAGRANMRAALEVLAERHGLDDASGATEVLVVGSSAGGMGVTGNLDLLQEKLGKTRERGKLKVILDGAWVPPWDLEKTPKANRWGPLLQSCERDRTEAKKDLLSCVFGPVWYPYYAKAGVPVLIQQSALDTTQLRAYKIKGKGPLGVWKENAKASFEGVDWLYSGGFRYHIVAFGPKFSAGQQEQTFREVVDAFWAGGEPQRVLFRYE